MFRIKLLVLALFLHLLKIGFGALPVEKNIAGIVEVGEELSTDGVLTSRQTMLRINVKPKLQFYEEVEQRAKVLTKMEIFLDDTFTKPISIESVKEKRVMSFRNVFYEISLENYFEHAQIHLHTCWSTPDQNASNPLKYVIVRDGCPEDDTFLMHKSNSPTIARFSVQSFRFVASLKPTFFMHCRVKICDGNSSQICGNGCSDTRRKRSSLDDANKTRNKLTEGQKSTGFFLNVACKSNKMLVSIRNPTSSINSFYHLNDPSCIGVKSSSQISFETQLNECGTVLSQSNGKLIYKNVIHDNVTNEIIIRHNPISIPFQCSYNQRVSSRRLKITLKQPKPKLKGIGVMPYKVKIEMFSDESYTRKLLQPIVEVDPGKLMFLQVRIDSKHFDLGMFLERCFALPIPYYSGNEMYTFIKDGCANDKTVRFYKDPNKSTKRFSMIPFTFGSMVTNMFINCHVTPCNAHSTKSICSKGCSKRYANRS